MRKHLLGATLALTVFSERLRLLTLLKPQLVREHCNTLIAAAKAAGLDSALATGQNLTVFAPTDDAFAKLPAGTVENLLKPENKAQLVAILYYHVLPRKLMSNQMMKGPFHVRTLKTDGDRLLAIAKGTGVTIDSANVVKADIVTDNGVIHVIDAVMLPSN